MTFAARSLGYLADPLTPTFGVTAGNGTNLGAKSETFSFVGWTTVASASANPGGAYGPDAVMGSVASGNPGLGTTPIIGAYSGSQASVTTTSFYGVVVAGTISSGFSTMTVAGTLIGGSPTYQALNTGTYTLVYWSRSDATSLFAGGGTKTVVVT